MQEAPMVDLVADLGEGFGAYRLADDDSLLDVVSSANIACGFHAGDPRIMDATVVACVRRGVGIGAHPGFPDLVGFGRRTMELTADEVRTDVTYQIGAMHAFAVSHSARLEHVTPHGRLGNLVVTDLAYAEAVATAVAKFDRSLAVVTQDGKLVEAARARGLRVGILGLADRAYNDDGTLVSRREPGAVLTDEHEIAERALRMVTEQRVRSVNGHDISIACDSILLHGDTPGAVSLARHVRAELLRSGVKIVALKQVLEAKCGA